MSSIPDAALAAKGHALLVDLARATDLVDHALEPYGLTLRRVIALDAIVRADAEGQPLSMREMGRDASADHAYMTRLLVAGGFVRREVDGADRRRVYLRPTQAGIDAVAVAGALAAQLLDLG